jgi:hypothetical protein
MDTGEDDLPGLFRTPAEEVEFWRTHTIDGRRCKPLEPVKIKLREPDLRMAPREPLLDLFDYLNYQVERGHGQVPGALLGSCTGDTPQPCTVSK